MGKTSQRPSCRFARRVRRSNAVPFNPNAVQVTPVGNVALTFSDGNTATFSYTVNGISQSKAITRQVFRDPGTMCM